MQEVHVFSSKRESITDIAKAIIKDFHASNELAFRFVKSKIASQLRTSFMGIFWLILPPIINTVVWVYLNSTLNFKIDTGGVPYPLFVFTSTTLWTIFADSLMICKNWFSANLSVLSKVDIPKEAIIISAFYELMFNTFIKICVFVMIVVFMQASQLYYFHYYLMGVFSTILFGFSIGLLLVPINVLIADVFSAIGLVMPILMLVTPVLYPLKTDGISYYINMFNPLTAMIDTPRSLFFGTDVTYLTSYLIYISISVLILLVALIFQRVAMPHLVVKMS